MEEDGKKRNGEKSRFCLEFCTIPEVQPKTRFCQLLLSMQMEKWFILVLQFPQVFA